MLKAIKESLKNWFIRYVRLYWYIVIGIAALLFGLVTGMGCAKLYDANAADDKAVRTLIEKIPLEVRQEYEHLVIARNESPSASGDIMAILWNGEPYAIVRWGDSAICPASSGLFPEIVCGPVYRYESGSFNYVKEGAGIVNTNDSTFYMPIIIYSSVDIYKQLETGNQHFIDEEQLLYTADTYPFKKQLLYDNSAAYITFEKLDVVNRLAEGDTGLGTVFSNLYDEFTKESKWRYNGVLKNINPLDEEYRLEINFRVELPTDAYIENLYHNADINMEWEHNLLRYCPDAVRVWNNDEKAPLRVYEFAHIVNVQPDENGRFAYELSFDQIRALIEYYNAESRTVFSGYEKDWLGLLFSFVHIDCTTASVRTSRSDSIVYGKVTTNQYDRGVFDICMEVIPDIDINSSTQEEIDKIIEEALIDAHNKYLEDLEKRLEELQGQMDDVGSIDGVFSDGLEGSDLWNGFKSLSNGLASLAPSIQSLSLLTGAVFAFVPLEIAGIMSFTLLAICIIAIIKAIRG